MVGFIWFTKRMQMGFFLLLVLLPVARECSCDGIGQKIPGPPRQKKNFGNFRVTNQPNQKPVSKTGVARENLQVNRKNTQASHRKAPDWELNLLPTSLTDHASNTNIQLLHSTDRLDYHSPERVFVRYAVEKSLFMSVKYRNPKMPIHK